MTSEIAASIGDLQSGQPLDPGTRQFFESSLGYDFSRVRVHTDSHAAEIASRLNARAFTLGHDIVFAPGQYHPAEFSGRRLIAHELVHTVQQKYELSPRLQRQAGGRQCGANCTPAQCGTLDGDFSLALEWTMDAAAALSRSSLTGQTRNALRRYFNLSDTSRIQDILSNIYQIHDRLIDRWTTGLINCQPSHCDPNTRAYVWRDNRAHSPIHLCPPYFPNGLQRRVTDLIHEAAHLAGLAVGRGEDIYGTRWSFRTQSSDNLVTNNADAYVLFIRAIATGEIPNRTVIGAGTFFGIGQGFQESDWFFSVFADATFQVPSLHLTNPALRLSFTVVGEPEHVTAGEESGKSAFLGLGGGVRFEDPAAGSKTHSLAIFGGVAVRVGETIDLRNLGLEVSAQYRYRWKLFDVGFGLSYRLHLGAEKGFENFFQIGPTISFGGGKTD